MTRQFDEEQINANRIKAGGKRTVHRIRPEIANIPTDCCNMILLREQQKIDVSNTPHSVHCSGEWEWGLVKNRCLSCYDKIDSCIMSLLPLDIVFVVHSRQNCIRLFLR